MNKKKLILLQMNEINFHLFEKKMKNLKFFSKFLNLEKKVTYSEEKYELLEPWIQWFRLHRQRCQNSQHF